MEKYLGSTERAGQGIAPIRAHRFDDVLVPTRFGKPRSVFLPGIPDLVRDSESVLSGSFSFSFSYSYSAPHLFGGRVEDFAGEVRELLASRSRGGIFWDWPGDTEVIVARKPGGGAARPRRLTSSLRVQPGGAPWRFSSGGAARRP